MKFSEKNDKTVNFKKIICLKEKASKLILDKNITSKSGIFQLFKFIY
jgi:hypothetical protein